MARLVDDLLDGRITRVALSFATSNRGRVVPSVCSRRFGARHVHEPRAHRHPASADGTTPTQRDWRRSWNLLNNACSFTDAGGHVSLSVHEEGRGRHPRAGTRHRHRRAPPEGVRHVAQADTPLERSRDGLGIGLTLVKTLAEMHGGSVGSRQRAGNLGRGSQFTVRLLMAAEAAEGAADAPRAGAETTSRGASIVDDSEDGAESLANGAWIGRSRDLEQDHGLEAIKGGRASADVRAARHRAADERYACRSIRKRTGKRFVVARRAGGRRKTGLNRGRPDSTRTWSEVPGPFLKSLAHSHPSTPTPPSAPTSDSPARPERRDDRTRERHQQRDANAVANVAGSLALRRTAAPSCAARRRYTPTTPGTMPMSVRRMPSAKIIRPTRDGSAPSARRTPISCDRCATVYASRP